LILIMQLDMHRTSIMLLRELISFINGGICR
jgi:hypothetical protein